MRELRPTGKPETWSREDSLFVKTTYRALSLPSIRVKMQCLTKEGTDYLFELSLRSFEESSVREIGIHPLLLGDMIT